MNSAFKSLFAATLAIVALAGCQKEVPAPDSSTSNTIHFKIHAGSPDTKTGIAYDAGGYTPYWNNGDQLGVLFTLPSSDGTLTNAAVFSNTKQPGQEAVFEGDVTLGDGAGILFYSYYPASAGKQGYYKDGVATLGLDVPSTQTPVYKESYGYSFDPAADLLIARPTTCIVVSGEATNENDMFFSRLTSVFRIELNAADGVTFKGEAVKSVKVETNNGDIAGRVVVNPVTGKYEKTNSITGSKAITASYDVSTTPLSNPVLIGTSGSNNVFLSVAPVTIPAASTLTFTIKTVNVSTGEDAHTLLKTVSSTPADIVFDSSKPTVIKLSLTNDNIQNNTIEYTLVKDVADLTVGSEIIIAAAGDNDKALGKTQNSNNRAAVDQEKSADGQIITPNSNVQILSVAAGKVPNTIALSTGEGYLCAASSGSNYLRTETALSNNSSWSVSIDGTSGVATIVAQGDYTRNTMQYNNTSAIFACYASASQGAVAIYKRSTPDNRQDVTLSFGTASYNLSVGTQQYSDFNGQTVTTSPDGVTGVTYALAGDAIGTVAEGTGVVALNGSEGTATITASFAGNDDYKPASSVSYTITVTDPNVVDYVTLNWTYPESGNATLDGLNAIDGVTTSGLGTYGDNQAPYMIRLDDTNDNIIVKTDVAIGEVSVIYKMIGGGNTSTLNILESADGTSFTAVEDLTISGSQNSVGTVTTSNAFAAASRYVKINFTKGSNIGIGGITINKVDTTPRFTVESPLEATIAGDTYNLSVTRKYFNGAITVSVPSECTWITATNIAANSNTFSVTVTGNTSAARSATLTLSGEGVTAQSLVVNQAGNEPGTEANPYTVPQALEFIETLGSDTSETKWVRGVVSRIGSYNSTYHSISYWISVGGSPIEELYVYSGKGLNGDNFNDITDLAVGDVLIIKGQLKNYDNTPEFIQSSQITSIVSQAARYTVAYSAGEHGSLSGPTSVGDQSSVTVTIAPDTGYELDVLTVGGVDVTSEVSENKYTFVMHTSDVTVSASFKEKQNSGTDSWQLVTSVSDLSDGDEIIIASLAADYAIGPQASNNRTGKSITATTDKSTLTAVSDDVIIISLEGSSNNWMFKTGTDSYLYACSSSNNYLRQTTKSSAGNNGKWTISINSTTYAATIYANGSNTRNYMRYNPNNGSPVFACYKSDATTGTLTAIYKKVTN